MSDRHFSQLGGVTLTDGKLNYERRGLIPTVVLDGVAKATSYASESNHNVKLAAAVTLLTLAIPDETAIELIYEYLESGTPDMKWRAARCLASVDVCTGSVARVLLSQITCVVAAVRNEAIGLVVQLSRSSTLIRALTAELLNSADHRSRLASVKLLPLLHGHTTRDIADKLLVHNKTLPCLLLPLMYR